VQAVTEHTERRQRRAQELHEHVTAWRLDLGVEARQALRGVPLTGAVTRIAERGDLTRVDHPRPLMPDLGLTPSESSSGERRRQGGITQTGKTHARRALVEAAWAYRDPANVSRHLQRRLEKLPKPRQDLSWQAQARLCTRDRQRSARGKPPNQVVVATARELIACMWAIATQVPVTA
jgi:transposase